MKKIMFMLMTILLMAMVSASYVYDYTFSANKDFTVKSYKCTSGVCSEGTISFYAQDTGNPNLISFSGTAPQASPNYYVLYYMPTDTCYLPQTGYRYFWGDGHYTRSSTLAFGRTPADYCGSNVEKKSVEVGGVEVTCSQVNENKWDCGEISQGDLVSFEARLQTAWDTTNTIANFIPGELDSYYSSHVNVRFLVNGVEQDSDTFDIPWNEWKTVSYDYTPSSAGTYVLRIETDMEDDCHCVVRQDGTRSNVKYKEIVVTITPPQEYCGDSLCNDGAGKTCEPNGPTQDFTCPDYTEIANGVCRPSGDYACTYCGDGVKQSGAGEECDLGDQNGVQNSGCDATCHTVLPYCGDSLCNDGAGKTCEPNGPTQDFTCPDYTEITNGICRPSGDYACTYCGDGVKQSGAGEECDEGEDNGEQGSTCSATCETVDEYCGDSICNDGSSATCEPNGGTKDMKCDDEVFTGDLSDDVCRTTGDYACTYCGDEVVQTGAGEECDLGDQNGVEGSGCTAICESDHDVPEFSPVGAMFLVIALGSFLLIKRR
jgi:hypothetical protein